MTDLKADPRNARRHSDRNKKLIRQSLEQVGAGRSILVDGDGIVRAGNGVYEQAQEIGLPVRVIESDGKELIAVQRTDLHGKDAIRAAALDNIVGDSSSYDYDAEILAEIARDDNVIEMLTKEDERLRELLRGEVKQEPKDAGELVDKAAELQAKWQVARGDVWQVGRHRVMCGDSTDAADVATLMQGEKAQIVFTDPPYGVNASGGRSQTVDALKIEKIKNDALAGDALVRFLCGAFSILPIVDNASIYVCYDQETQGEFTSAFNALNWRRISTIVWNKDNFGLSGHKGYRPKFELIAFCSHSQDYRWFGNNDQADVWDVPRPRRIANHPTPKPIELFLRGIVNSSEQDDILIDSFCGVGTSLVTCEQTGRIGRGMEIEPKYVAVTLERLTVLGLEATRNAG